MAPPFPGEKGLGDVDAYSLRHGFAKAASRSPLAFPKGRVD